VTENRRVAGKRTGGAVLYTTFAGKGESERAQVKARGKKKRCGLPILAPKKRYRPASLSDPEEKKKGTPRDRAEKE